MIDYGHGVYLDTVDEADLETFRKWRNHKDIWKYCRQNDLISQIDQINWFNRQNDAPDIRMYALRSGKALVGMCGLTGIDLINRRAELSLFIGIEHQRSGYAERGLKTLFKHGFQNLGLNIIFAEMIEYNPVLRLLKRLGMKIEGVRREFYLKDGEFHNAALLSIKRDEIGY